MKTHNEKRWKTDLLCLCRQKRAGTIDTTLFYEKPGFILMRESMSTSSLAQAELRCMVISIKPTGCGSLPDGNGQYIQLKQPLNAVLLNSDAVKMDCFR